MVVCTTVAVATVLTGGAAALAGAKVGIDAALAAAAAGEAVATGLSGGVILGTGATTSIGGAGIGTVASVSASGAIVSMKKGVEKGEDGGKWFLLGASDDSGGNGITYDCWKPVVHDKSREPSKGKFLNEIISHPNISRTTVTTGDHPDLPNIVIENIWGEVFEIEYLLLHTTMNIVCHATQI